MKIHLFLSLLMADSIRGKSSTELVLHRSKRFGPLGRFEQGFCSLQNGKTAVPR